MKLDKVDLLGMAGLFLIIFGVIAIAVAYLDPAPAQLPPMHSCNCSMHDEQPAERIDWSEPKGVVR